jgi:hypothetical protein
MSEWKVSTTDPDATPMRTGARTTLGYHDHYVVDGGRRRIILAAFVTPADVTDNMPMRDLLWRVCFRRKIWPHHVTGDAKYGTTENVASSPRVRLGTACVDCGGGDWTTRTSTDA